MTAFLRLARWINGLGRSRDGNVAMMFGLGGLVLAMVMGFAVDVAHQHDASESAQGSLDAAVLAAASSSADTEAEVQEVIEAYLAGNIGVNGLNPGYRVTVDFDGNRINALINGTTSALFSGLIGRGDLPINVDSTAVRGTGEAVELVLVVDNTWSMSADAGGGMTRIQALRAAALALVDGVMIDGAEVRVSIVPYADYVNVGTGYRNASWLNVPADYSTTTTPPRTCRANTRTTCTGGVRGTCTGYTDGVPYSYSCWTTPQTCTTQPAPGETCSGGTPQTTNYRWYGCVASRNSGNLRRSDRSPSVRYPGFLGTSQRCLNPIIPLTDDRSRVRSAINGLIINIGGYQPATYIPAGMIWGLNAISPGAPFPEGAPYGEDTRKIIVLMTDGSNTLQYRASDGMHAGASSPGPADADARAICDYAKSLDIEIYTVGLAVPAGPSRNLMRDCATSEATAYDADNAADLIESFRAIARSINAIRLTD